MESAITDDTMPSWYDLTQRQDYRELTLGDKVDCLAANLNDAQLGHNALLTVVQRMKRDFALVAERFNQEAISRGWCGEYETVINELNGQMQQLQFPPRRISSEVDYIVRIRITRDQGTDYPNVGAAIQGELNEVDWDAYFGSDGHGNEAPTFEVTAVRAY